MSAIHLPPSFRPWALVFWLSPAALLAQFDKANALFQHKRYAAAAPLFEAGLQEKNNLVAQSRLAYCYRMLNQTEKAEAIYADVVTHDKARAETYLYYAESLMSNGKYAEAKDWFLKYHRLEPDDSTALRRAEACDLVPGIQPYFPGSQTEAFAHNSEADDNTPAFWRGGLVFTSDRPSGKMILKEKSTWTGRDYLKLWYAPFDTATGQFGAPESFSGKFNALNKNSANASFTADWGTVFFSRNSETANRKDEYTMQLYTAERGNGRWKNEHKLDFCLPALNYMHPAVSPDGRLLFFAANAGGAGGFDIFVAEQLADGKWGRVRNLGPAVNTPAHEAFPFFHADGRLFFCSKGHAGYGGFDVFVTRFDTAAGQWSKPLNLGRPVNSPLDDIGFHLAPDGSLGAFTSGRDGGDDDIYLFWTGEKPDLRRAFYLPDTDKARQD